MFLKISLIDLEHLLFADSILSIFQSSKKEGIARFDFPE